MPEEGLTGQQAKKMKVPNFKRRRQWWEKTKHQLMERLMLSACESDADAATKLVEACNDSRLIMHHSGKDRPTSEWGWKGDVTKKPWTAAQTATNECGQALMSTGHRLLQRIETMRLQATATARATEATAQRHAAIDLNAAGADAERPAAEDLAPSNANRQCTASADCDATDARARHARVDSVSATTTTETRTWPHAKAPERTPHTLPMHSIAVVTRTSDGENEWQLLPGTWVMAIGGGDNWTNVNVGDHDGWVRTTDLQLQTDCTNGERSHQQHAGGRGE